MRTIGLIGGMSWESTAIYYRLMNEHVRDHLGPLRSCPILLYSFDFEQIKSLQHAGNWREAAQKLATAADTLAEAGAEAIVLCTNTMHKVASEIETRLRVPFIHLADSTAVRIRRAGINQIALLGTRFTMEEDFYISRLRSHGLDVIIPHLEDRNEIHRTIYEELCAGIIHERSRQRYMRIVEGLAQRGAEGVILGCTEITLLIGPADVTIPVFDTTEIHAWDAAEFSMGTRKPPLGQRRVLHPLDKAAP
jgi:aspartate racemase